MATNLSIYQIIGENDNDMWFLFNSRWLVFWLRFGFSQQG